MTARARGQLVDQEELRCDKRARHREHLLLAADNRRACRLAASPARGSSIARASDPGALFYGAPSAVPT